MKNQLKYVVALLAIFIVLAVFLMGCLQEASIEDTTAPANVTGLTAVEENGGITLSWINPTDSDFNGVEVSLNPAIELHTDSVILGKTVNNLLVGDLIKDVEYTFIVKSIDASLNYSSGSTVIAKISDSSSKITPTNVTDLTVIVASGKAKLTWVNPTDSDFNGVEVSVSPAAGTLANPVILGKTVNTLSVSELTNGTEYVFTVKSIDTRLNYSNGISSITTVEDTNPPDITNLKAVNMDASILLIWTDVSDEDIYGYEVSWDKEDAAINRNIEPVSKNSMIVAPGSGGCYINGLANGTTYIFTIKTQNLTGKKSKGLSTTITPEVISSSDPMSISLIPTTIEPTKNDIKVSIDITSADSISKVVYKPVLEFNTTELLESGTEIVANNGTYSFMATSNGTYSVAAKDTLGRQNISYITIDNIDKKPTTKITKLKAVFSYRNKAITVRWTDPIEKDYDRVSISYKAGDALAVVAEVKKGIESLSIPVPDENLEGVEYTIEVASIDTVNNYSDIETVVITTDKGPLITSIRLDRPHISCEDTNRDIKVIIEGENFDELASFSSESTIEVAVIENSTLTPVEIQMLDKINIDKKNNIATITFTAPYGVNTEAGEDYTVYVTLITECIETKTVLFNSSAPLTYSTSSLSISEIDKDEVNNDSITTLTINGTNLDIQEIKIYTFDSKGHLYGNDIIVNKSDLAFHTTTFTQDIKIPTVSDQYTILIYIDGVYHDSKILNVKGDTEVASLYIPKAGISKADDTVTAVIRGKNFVSTDDILIKCDDTSIGFGTPTVVNYSKIILPITIPGTAGTYKVTVNDIAADFEVKDYSDYAIGDVILKDGTKVDAVVSSITDEEKANAVAVIAAFNDYGAAIGVGLKNQDSFTWASEGCFGYNTLFSELVCKSSGSGINRVFTGDVDGSDNWQEVCLVDPVGVLDPATNYPAFDYANKYSQNVGLAGTDYENGWYLSGITELNTVIMNISTVNSSLNKVGGQSILTYNYYWTSSTGSMPGYSANIRADSANPYIYISKRNESEHISIIRIF